MLGPVSASIFLPFLTTPWHCTSIYPAAHKVMWSKEPDSHPMVESWSNVKTLVHFLGRGSEMDLGCSLWESLWGRGHLWEFLICCERSSGKKSFLFLWLLSSLKGDPPTALILWTPEDEAVWREQSRDGTGSCGLATDCSVAGIPRLSGHPVKWDNPQSPRNPGFSK